MQKYIFFLRFALLYFFFLLLEKKNETLSSNSFTFFSSSLANSQSLTLDQSFGNNGSFVIHLPESKQSDPSSFIMLSDYQYIICASGYSSTNGLSFPILAKYIENGKLSMNEENAIKVHVYSNPFVDYIDFNIVNRNDILY